jgi:hypothetical protein
MARMGYTRACTPILYPILYWTKPAEQYQYPIPILYRISIHNTRMAQHSFSLFKWLISAHKKGSSESGVNSWRSSFPLIYWSYVIGNIFFVLFLCFWLLHCQQHFGIGLVLGIDDFWLTAILYQYQQPGIGIAPQYPAYSPSLMDRTVYFVHWVSGKDYRNIPRGPMKCKKK